MAILLAGWLARAAYPAPVRLTVRLERKPGGVAVTQAAQAETVAVLSRRINALGIAEASVRADGPQRITMALPRSSSISAASQQAALLRIIAPAELELIWLKDCKAGRPSGYAGNPKGRYEYLGGMRLRDTKTRWMLTPDKVRSEALYRDSGNVIVTSAMLRPGGARVDLGDDPRDGVGVALEFTPVGTRRLAEFTRTHVGALLAFVLNGTILSAPRIQGEIPDGRCFIALGAGSVAEAQELANMLDCGAMPLALHRVK